MRIKEEFKRSGDFWLPSEPDRKERGELSISDGGAIELEVDGRFNVEPEALLRNRLERIVGNIKNNDGKNEFVTLDRCYYKSPTTDGGSKPLIGVVGRVCTGEGYNGESCFKAVTFSVEGIDEWVGKRGKRGINIVPQFEESAATISYKRPEDISIHLGKGMQLSIICGWKTTLPPAIKEATIRQKTYFKLVSEEARELDEFVSIAHKITTFLCFAIDKMVSLDSMEATSDKDIGEGRTRPIRIDIYYPSQPYSTDEPKIHQDDMLFGFGQIQDDPEGKINNWLKAYERLNPTFDLYFSTQIGKPYLTVRLLTLVQGLEAYHQRKCDEKQMAEADDEKQMAEAEFKELFKNLMNQCPKEHREWLHRKLKRGKKVSLSSWSLSCRLRDLIEPFKEVFGNEDERRKLICKIKKERNYLTHYNPKDKSKAAKAQDLLYLCLKIELLFQLHFLRLIGFSPEQIDCLAKSIALSRKRYLLSGCRQNWGD